MSTVTSFGPTPATRSEADARRDLRRKALTEIASSLTSAMFTLSLGLLNDTELAFAANLRRTREHINAALTGVDSIARKRIEEIKAKGEFEAGEVINLVPDDWHASGTSDTEPKS